LKFNTKISSRSRLEFETRLDEILEVPNFDGIPNAGGIVNFESHNFFFMESFYGKKVCNQYFGNVSTSATRM